MLKELFSSITLFFASLFGLQDAQPPPDFAAPTNAPAVEISEPAIAQIAPGPAASTTTVINQITHPIIERIVERSSGSHGPSTSDLAVILGQLQDSMRTSFSDVVGRSVGSSINSLAEGTLTLADLTDANIPDTITASNYLALTGGTLSGDLSVTGDFTVTGAQTLSGAISVPYINATSTTATSTFAGGLTAGELTVDRTTGFVGIGTTTPYAKLSIAGNVAVGNTVIRTGTSTNTSIGDNSGPTTVGDANTFLGYHAGMSVTDSRESTLIGYRAGEAMTGTGDPVHSGINTFIGSFAGLLTTTGINNTFVGQKAGSNNVTGDQNLYLGIHAGGGMTGSQNIVLAGGDGTIAGDKNILIGWATGLGTGTQNETIAIGAEAGRNVTTADQNIFIGGGAGKIVTTGTRNTFMGYRTGYNSTTASDNTLIGYNAGYSANGSAQTTAIGVYAGYGATSASYFTALGYRAGNNFTTGQRLTAIGNFAGFGLTTQNRNVMIGDQSGNSLASNDNVFVGSQAGDSATTGGNNVAIGSQADIAAGVSNSIAIGKSVTVSTNNTAVFGPDSITTTLLKGNVGIGTTTPSHQFMVSRNSGQDIFAVERVGTQANFFDFTITSAPDGSNNTLANGSLTINAQGSAADVALRTDPTVSSPQFVVKASGNVGIGTTSPWRKLSVTGTVGFDGLTGATGAGSLCLSADNEVVFNSGSDACLPSLRSTKHDIATLEPDAISAVLALEPVSFVYNEGDGRTRYGFIAEDTAEVLAPLATYNASSNVSGIDDRAILSVVVTAIKEIAARLTQLFDNDARHDIELEALKERVQDLEERAGVETAPPPPPPEETEEDEENEAEKDEEETQEEIADETEPTADELPEPDAPSITPDDGNAPDTEPEPAEEPPGPEPVEKT